MKLIDFELGEKWHASETFSPVKFEIDFSVIVSGMDKSIVRLVFLILVLSFETFSAKKASA